MLTDSKRQKLVHLNALRAFEAAARQLSFVAAAEELNVTPSAISQHIKSLEDYLGVKLFQRSKVGISLTQEARAAYPDVKDGLDRLVSGLTKMRGAGVDHIITVTMPPSFAAKWLLPRIERFRERHPEFDMRLDTSNRLADLHAEDIDVAIRYGLGGYAGLESDKLMSEEVFPVCSPRLLPPNGSIDIERLAHMTLIHDTTIDFDPGFPSWSAWFKARGVRNIDPARGLQFNSSIMAIQAALDGQGVALGRSVIVRGDIESGRLVRPFSDAVEKTRCAYYLVYEPQMAGSPKLEAMREWLLEEIARERG